MPTFPHARHVFSRKEHAFFTDPANENERTRTSFRAQQDSIDPIIKAGLAEQIEVDGGSPVEDFAFHPTPGHSPDHAAIILRSQGQTALFAGDVFHHPAEIVHPELYTSFDPEPDEARHSRRWALDFAINEEALIFTSHCPASSCGRVTRRRDGYSWVFA